MDGGARGAPGPAAPGAAAIGFVIDDQFGDRVEEHAEPIGAATAAEAEYRALLAGLLRARELGLGRVLARSDSRLLVGHVNGERNIRSTRLQALEAEISDACKRIGTVIVEWIPAAANAHAHGLVDGAMHHEPADPADAAGAGAARRGGGER